MSNTQDKKKNTNIFDRIIRRIETFGFPKEKELKKGVLIHKTSEDIAGKSPEVPFLTLWELYRDYAIIATAIDQTEAEITGPGYYIECDEKYKTKLPKGDGDTSAWTAEECLDAFSLANDLDNLYGIVVKDLLMAGNCWLMITDTGGIEIIPLEAIYYIKPAIRSVPIRESYTLELTGTYDSKKLKPEQFIHLTHGVTSSSAPYGIGICQKMYLTHVSDELSMIDMLEMIYKANIGIAMKTAFGHQFYEFEDASDKQVEEWEAKINEANYGGRFVHNTPVNIKGAPPIDRSKSTDEFLKFFLDQLYIILDNPALPLATKSTSMVTKASAETGKSYHELKIDKIQREIKRQFESIFRKVLTEAGFDADKADPRLIWGLEEDPELELADIFTAVEKGVATKNEAREMLKEMGWKLEDELPEEEITPKIPEEGIKPVELKEAEDDCEWKTIRGRRICIKPGETPEDALKRMDKGEPKLEPSISPKRVAIKEKYKDVVLDKKRPMEQTRAKKEAYIKEHGKHPEASQSEFFSSLDDLNDVKRQDTKRSLVQTCRYLKGGGLRDTAGRLKKGGGTPGDQWLGIEASKQIGARHIKKEG